MEKIYTKLMPGRTRQFWYRAGIVTLLFTLLCCVSTNVQAQQIKVSGKVSDYEGIPLPGVNIVIQGTTRGVISDLDGSFSIDAQSTDNLRFSFIGMEDEVILVGNNRDLTVKLKPKANEVDEVTVVAFATQKKESVIASVSTIKPSELRVASSNLTTALAGRIAGLISYQRTGEPGADNAEFFIRGVTNFGTGKKDPLILIDGVEMTKEDLSRMNTDDVASFSIMKDANATALYGARGANGVILVNTKEGREGKVKIQFRSEVSLSSPTETVDLADPVTFMKLNNEAVRTRQIGVRMPYDEKKINYTERGIDPVRYPANDWQDILFKKNTVNQRYNLNISGGGTIAKYYVAAAYSKDTGIVKTNKAQDFDSNINLSKYSLRSNVNINLTKSTEVIIRLSGNFDDYAGPLDGGTDLFKKAVHSNPVYFSPTYKPDEANKFAKHILFGNAPSGGYLNPYAEMLKGYRSESRSNMYLQFELKQNLDFITKGLSLRSMYNVDRFSQLDVKRQYNPFFYSLAESDDPNDYRLIPLNPNSGTDYLDYVPGKREASSTMYFESALSYNTAIAEKHSISALAVFTLREKVVGDVDNNTLELSLPHRNAGLAGRLTYSYDHRYFFEGNFGYNGSERFSKDKRWGFFPSAGLGWIVSNEEFMKSASFISKLKLKATYGLVGNDAIGDDRERFFYLSNLNMNDGGRSYTFGGDYGYSRNGVSISRYADPTITWEVSYKSNFGIELELFNNLEIQADYFRERRVNILQSRSDIPSTMGLQATPSTNIGKAVGSGVDVSIDYNKSFNRDFWTLFRGNFTYASSQYLFYDEPDYSATPWRYHKGQNISQRWGYVAERLFLDDEEVRNSPTQTFGTYGAGDIKYKDINNDGKIDENDLVPIGFPTTPEIIVGFGATVGYKNLDFSFFFQGSARSSFWISPEKTAPFVPALSSDNIPGITNRGLLQAYADSHWSEDNRDIYALWPRLSTSQITNNEQRSTWWMRDGSFLRLKTAEIGYTLPSNLLKRYKVSKVRVYAAGNNLFIISAFKMWDPEKGDNGFNYPIQRVINLGINIEF